MTSRFESRRAETSETPVVCPFCRVTHTHKLLDHKTSLFPWQFSAGRCCDPGKIINRRRPSVVEYGRTKRIDYVRKPIHEVSIRDFCPETDRFSANACTRGGRHDFKAPDNSFRTSRKRRIFESGNIPNKANTGWPATIVNDLSRNRTVQNRVWGGCPLSVCAEKFRRFRVRRRTYRNNRS